MRNGMIRGGDDSSKIFQDSSIILPKLSKIFQKHGDLGKWAIFEAKICHNRRTAAPKNLITWSSPPYADDVEFWGPAILRLSRFLALNHPLFHANSSMIYPMICHKILHMETENVGAHAKFLLFSLNTFIFVFLFQKLSQHLPVCFLR